MKKLLIFLVVLTNIAIIGFSQSDNYAGENGMILETKTDGNMKWVFRKHIQNVKIGDLSRDENLIIYNNPILENGNIIGRLKLDDNINISQVAEAIIEDDYYYWLKINTDNNISGWIYCGKYNYTRAQYQVPYFDNQWEIIETIQIYDHIWTVRKQRSYLSIWRTLDVRDRPGLNGSVVLFELIPVLPKDNDGWTYFVDGFAITEEMDTIDGRTDHWVKIKDKQDRIGWIFGGYGEVERGGPKYFTPENIILTKLGWY